MKIKFALLKNLLSKVKRAFKRAERCSICGMKVTRLKWGGRNHFTSKGSQFVHPIDYFMYSKVLRGYEQSRSKHELHKGGQVDERN